MATSVAKTGSSLATQILKAVAVAIATYFVIQWLKNRAQPALGSPKPVTGSSTNMPPADGSGSNAGSGSSSSGGSSSSSASGASTNPPSSGSGPSGAGPSSTSDGPLIITTPVVDFTQGSGSATNLGGGVLINQ